MKAPAISVFSQSRVAARLENAQLNHQSALESFQKVLEVQIGKFGPTNRAVLATRSSIAETYALQGRYESAANEYEEIVELQGREIGVTHPDRLNTLLELGDAYFALGSSGKAEATYREAVAGFMTTLGPNDPQTSRAAEYLGKLGIDARE